MESLGDLRGDLCGGGFMVGQFAEQPNSSSVILRQTAHRHGGSRLLA